MQICYRMYVDSCGYGIAAQEYILSMLNHEVNLNITIEPMRPLTKKGVSNQRYQIFHKFSQVSKQKPMVVVNHCLPSMYRYDKKFSKHVGFFVFETTDVPKHWKKNLDNMDVIITASDFNKIGLRRIGVTNPIKVIPHCFDPKMFHKDVKPESKYAATTFMAIGTWKNRKNWETLIKAFFMAFEKKDDVCLLIKTKNEGELSNTVRRIKTSRPFRQKPTAPVYAERSGIVPFEKIPSMMKKADFYISCSYGEGFGYPGLHAAALGIPIIVPNFGGFQMYAKPDQCMLINPKGMQRLEKMDNISQFRNKMWPVITAEEVKSKLRLAYENYPQRYTDETYDYVHNHFSYNHIGPKFLETLKF